MNGAIVEASDLADGLSAFVDVRPRLFGVAYRMLGNAAEAEDIVQDVWLRWQTADRSVVRDASAFLITMATRLTINRANSGYSRREACVGSRHPEPTDIHVDAGFVAERGEALASAVSLLLEKLSPTERAAYVLREAFAYEYSEIAQILRVSEVNGRQLVARARKRIVQGRRAPVSAGELHRLCAAFTNAAQNGDLAALERLFARSSSSSPTVHALMNAKRSALNCSGCVAMRPCGAP